MTAYRPRRFTAISLLIGILLSASLNNEAGANPACAHRYSDAVDQAKQYSFTSGGIGLVLGYGNDQSRIKGTVSDRFLTEIQKRRWVGQSFCFLADWHGLSVEYHIADVTLGPYRPREAAGKMSEAIAMARAAQRVHHHSDALLLCADRPDYDRCVDAIIVHPTPLPRIRR